MRGFVHIAHSYRTLEVSQIKPKVGTICVEAVANQGVVLLTDGGKAMRYAMPNARIMGHQPQSDWGVNSFRLFLLPYF
ncbi:ATP-dependent Clp protease proteolytic subunit [Capsicum chinense]|nr:ATP-dependent Clp protease proteolytic subunit [Capsicum chinense]